MTCSTLLTLSLFLPAAAPTHIHTDRLFGPEHPAPYKHPAAITELTNGDLYLVYYGGSGEYATDTAVYDEPAILNPPKK